MITKTTSYQVGDALYASLAEAQQAEIDAILAGSQEGLTSPMPISAAAAAIVANAPKVIDILSTTAKSRVRARKANGATRKPRNSKPSTGAALHPATPTSLLPAVPTA